MKTIYTFNDPIRLVQARHGYMAYNQYCHYVGRALELYGEYCEHEVELMADILKPADVVWEIGANTGSMSVALATRVKEGMFIGFEPQPELYKIFVTNLTLNNCENARSFNFGLGRENSIIQLPKVNYHQPNNFGSLSLVKEAQEKSNLAVEIRTIDDLNWLPSPNFLKIDVEGMELDVLVGGKETIRKTSPIIYVENDRVDQSKELIEYLWSINYECYWHITPYFNHNNFFKNPNNIYGPIGSFNMLCASKGSSLKIEGLPKIVDSSAHPMKK